MNLDEIRQEIDTIDKQIAALFTQRMDCSVKVAEYKMENGLPIFNPQREMQVLDKIEAQSGKYGTSARLLYATILELSRALQHDMLGSGEKLYHRIANAGKDVPYEEQNLRVVCFGIEGTYAHRACLKTFPHASPFFRPTFYEVFSAVNNGEADFGVVPIENSSAGSVTDVYDLMLKYRFSIVSAVHLPIDHCLAAREGCRLEDIRMVYSHQQALSQCSNFLRSRSLPYDTCQSTAAAAEMVSQSDRTDIAAICSEEAAKTYGLTILKQGFQNNPHNMTRFIIISKQLYIESDADKISLCFSLPHQTGSLYNILCRFASNGLNLTKIESRPVQGTEFEYLFYLDFSGNVNSPRTISMLRALSDEMTEFSFLGNYKEK